MSYNIIAVPNFRREIKKLIKKYPSLKNDFALLVKSLEQNPEQGTSIGNHCYKLRLAIASKGKGKSGGARVITYLQVFQTTVFLLSIYDKSEQENIGDKELTALIKLIP